jgi:superfamily II DNA or RNA helicase
MNTILIYTNKLLTETFTKQEVEEFNSQRKSLLDAWKANYKYLGTFDDDNKSNISKDGLLNREENNLNPNKIIKLTAAAKRMLALRKRQEIAMQLHKKRSPVRENLNYYNNDSCEPLSNDQTMKVLTNVTKLLDGIRNLIPK